MLREFRHHDADRMCTDDGVHGAIGAEQEEARRIGTTRDIRQPRQRRHIAPVEVFQHQHERALGGEDIQGFGQLAQHAGLCGLTRGPLEALPCGRRHQHRHLDEPARGVLPQRRNEPLPHWFPAETSQCLQEGQIGFTRPIVIQALAVPHPDIPSGRHLGHKRVDQDGLTDAGLPRDDRHLPRALTGYDPPLCQLGQGRVAPHKVRRAAERGRRHATRGLLLLRPARRY